MQAERYPKINIRSKNELAKRLSYKKFPIGDALRLINDVVDNFDAYWVDNHSQSKPSRNKYVRSARGTPLGRLLDNINKKILTPYDKMLPNFIFGGVKGLNHVKAVYYLLGVSRKRAILRMDIERFFEQISEERVYHFFHNKCSCSKRAAKLIASLCCVPQGPKNSSDSKTIARGFATSPRLAVWCNLDLFIRINYLVNKRLRGHDPRLAIYVDDIGVTASRVTKNEMSKLYLEIRDIMEKFDSNQKLPVNNKTEIIFHDKGMEHLGLKMYRNKLSIGSKTKSKLDKEKHKRRSGSAQSSCKRYKSLRQYKNHIERWSPVDFNN
ncbi:MAG: reverse transcriptase domain-containing protein [Candidatus Paceibacterota bacterium]|jgi:hypothetical protein